MMIKNGSFSLSEPIKVIGIVFLLLVIFNPSNNLSRGSTIDSSYSLSQFQSNVTSVSFDSVMLGQSLNKTIQLSNNASETIEVTNIQLGSSSEVFSWTDDPIILGEDESFDLVITYTPETEVTSSEVLSIEANDSSSVSITLTGKGVSIPMIYRVEFSKGATNQSTVNGTISISVWANDTSAISSVSLSIGSDLKILERVEGDLFTYDWKTKDYKNGQYVLTITAEDIYDRTISVVYVFTVENEAEESAFEKLQNPTTIAIISVIVFIIFIGVVTWFRRSFKRAREYGGPRKV